MRRACLQGQVYCVKLLLTMSIANVNEYPHTERERDFDVREFWIILRKRRMAFLNVFVLVVVLGGLVTFLSKPLYRTQAKLLVPAGSNALNLVDPNNPLASLFQTGNPDSIGTQIQDLQSTAFQEEAKKAAGVVPQPGVIPTSVRVEAVRDTNIIEITVDGGNPRKIKALADALVDMHLDRTDELRDKGLNRSLKFMLAEVKQASDDLLKANQALLRFRSTHPVTEIDSNEESLKGYLDLQAQALAAESNLTSSQAELRNVQRRLASLPADLVRKHRVSNPQVAALQEKLRQLAVQRLDLLQNYQPTSGPVRAIEEQIENYKKQLATEPESLETKTFVPNPLRDTLEVRQTELEAALVKYRQALATTRAQLNLQQRQMSNMGPSKFRLDQLTQKQERAQTRFNMLSDKLQDLRIRKESNVRMARVIEGAGIPGSPIQPKPLLNMLLAVCIGLFLAVGTVFLQEFLDDRLDDPSDLERLVGLPSLGHVPTMPTDQAHLVSELPSNSPISEAYRTVRSSIGFAGLDSEIRRLQVTSASKGEGKTLTSVNIATAMAMDGKKVILVDADLRRPNVHRTLSIAQTPGLSEVLVGMKRWEEVIVDTDTPNLRVICAGTMPPNPAELLGTRAFDQVMDSLTEQADIVIVDTPPCMPVTDPLIIASRMDGIVLVINAGQTRRAAIRLMVNMLSRTRTKILGAIFNRVDSKKGGYYYHYYYHYYGDGYYSDTDSNGGGQNRKNGKPMIGHAASKQESDGHISTTDHSHR